MKLRELFRTKKYSEFCLLCGREVKNPRRKYCSDICSQKHAVYLANKIPKERWDIPTETERKEYSQIMKIRKDNYRNKKKLDFCELCVNEKAVHRHHEGELIICCCRKCHNIIHKYLKIKYTIKS
jgi:hypothetical protein